MMFSGGRGGMSLGGPGQREVSHKDVATEVGITLSHTGWAALAGFVLGLVLRYALIAPIAQAVVNQWPKSAAQIIPAEAWLSWRFVLLCAFAPVVALWVSFVIQVFNVNFPPPYSAANPREGFFGGMFGRHTDAPPPQQEYQGDTPSVDVQQKSFWLHIPDDKNPGHKVWDCRLQLPHDEWVKLRHLALNDKSFSARGLKDGGFGWDRAKALSSLLIAENATWHPDNNNTVARAAFKQWLMDGGFDS